MNKKAISFVMAVLLCFGLTACGESTGGSENSDSDRTSETVLDGKEFETDERFISIADVPPVNFDKLDDYVALGFSGYILTEDGVKLTNNGVMTEAYKNAAAAVKKAGLDVYIRNQYNDPDYFQNDDGDTLRNKFVVGYSYKETCKEFLAYLFSERAQKIAAQKAGGNVMLPYGYKPTDDDMGFSQ